MPIYSPPTVSLHTQATKSQNPYTSTSRTKKSPFDVTKTTRRSMSQAPQQHNRMAYPPTTHQPNPSRRPDYNTDKTTNAPNAPRRIWEACSPSRRQTRPQQHAPLIPSRAQGKIPRKPLQPLQHNTPDPASEYRNSKEPPLNIDLYSMIDSHLAWNMSASNLSCRAPEQPRPGSCGTMFLDFKDDGEMEVSFRRGRGKKLPPTPVPLECGVGDGKAVRRVEGLWGGLGESEEMGEAGWFVKAGRHDSLIEKKGGMGDYYVPPFYPPNEPLLQLPLRTSSYPQNKTTYPPRVHDTLRTVSTTKAVGAQGYLSAPSITPTPYRTARDVDSLYEDSEAIYTVIEPEGETVSYRPCDAATNVTPSHRTRRPDSPRPHPLRMNPQLPRLQTTKYVSIQQPPSSVSLLKLPTNKPLPPLPLPSAQNSAVYKPQRDTNALPKKDKNRGKIRNLVKNLLRRLGELADEFHEYQLYAERVKAKPRGSWSAV